MLRERALKVVLAVVGLLFTAAIYPITMILWHRDQPGYTDAMMGSLYVTLGILLLIAVRKPAAHRSLIAFAGWSSVAHAAVMTIMVFRDSSQRGLLPGVYIFLPVGIALLALAPAKQSVERVSVASA
jgi:uncharacterized protein DUF6632